MAWYEQVLPRGVMVQTFARSVLDMSWWDVVLLIDFVNSFMLLLVRSGVMIIPAVATLALKRTLTLAHIMPRRYATGAAGAKKGRRTLTL